MQDALANGSTTCLVRTVDTDVIIIIGKFHALLAKYPAADIWIELYVYSVFTSMMSAMTWEMTNLWHFLFFIALLVVIQPQLFGGRGRSKHAWEAWKCYPQVTQAFLYMASHPHIEINCGVPKLPTSGTLHSHSIWQGKQSWICQWGKKGVVLSEEQNNENHSTPKKMHCCSTENVLHIRLESGPPVIWLNSKHQLQKDMVGHWTEKATRGFLYGPHYQWPLKPAVN